MPLQKLQLRPGINREATTLSNEGGYYACDKVRFRSGFPEQIGGWTRLSSSTYLGTARALINWATLDNKNYLGVGTNVKYYIENGGVYNDITPIIITVTYTNPISTAFTTLSALLDSDTTAFMVVTSATGFPPSGTVKIGTEEIGYTSVDTLTNTLRGLSRGLNGTLPATHTSGSNVGCSRITFNDAGNAVFNNSYVILSGATDVGGIPNTLFNREQKTVKVSDGAYDLWSSY
jgi:hypothetical protein